MKKSFIKELLHRRIPQIIGSYFIASTSMILFLDWLKVNYAFPKEYITLALFGAVSILPSVIILAYFHGAPGKDEWTKIEKIGVPINIIFIFSLLVIGYKGNWWFDNNDKPNQFFIHITSDEEYIEDYYSDNLGLITGINWDRDDYLITPVSDSLLKYLHKNIYSNMVSQFHHLDLQIDTYISKEEYEVLNMLPSPRKYIKRLLENMTDEEPSAEFLDSLRSIYLPEEPYIKFRNIIEKRVKHFSLDFMIVVNVYNVLLKETNEAQGIFYEPHLYVKDNTKRDRYIPGSWHGDHTLYTDNKKLITNIGKVLYGWTYKKAIGTLKVGIITELLDDNLVKIELFDKNQSIHRNMILENWINYHWLKDGYEKRIEDIELALEYYKKHEDVFDSTQFNSLTAELQSYVDGSGRNKGESMSMGWGYNLEVVDITGGAVLAKITSKRNPYLKVRKGDKIRLVFD